MRAFKVSVGGRDLDYRVPGKINIPAARKYFSKRYKVRKIWGGGRHVLGDLEKGNGRYFLKLSTSPGISVLTQNEARWNEEFNRKVSRKENVWVPQNEDQGFFEEKFYLVMEHLEGVYLSNYPKSKNVPADLISSLEEIVEATKMIQTLNLGGLEVDEKMGEKIIRWFDSIDEEVANKYKLDDLCRKAKASLLDEGTTRHGDFTPWHLIRLKNGKIGLLDGEHARSNSAQCYDIGYFVQRLFSVLGRAEIAKEFLNACLEGGFRLDNLKGPLLARSLGGFLDEQLRQKPDYKMAEEFKSWVYSLD